MEPTNQDANNTMNASVPGQNEFQNLLHKKWLLIVVGVAVLLMLVIGIFLAVSPKTSRVPDKTGTGDSAKKAPSPTNSPELQAAIDEAKQTAQAYDQQQEQVIADYSWIRTLPIGNEKYFVYFDTDKKVFIGRLYPKAGDNVEQMKTLIQQELKIGKKIPVENYTFEWQVNPK